MANELSVQEIALKKSPTAATALDRIKLGRTAWSGESSRRNPCALSTRLSGRRASPPTAFADDFTWFTGLLEYFEQTKGETVIRARTFDEAKKRDAAFTSGVATLEDHYDL